jgi:MFS family permease
MSIPYIISAVLSPPLGHFVDRYGYRAVIAAISPALIVGVHLILGVTDLSCIGPLVGQGLAYTGFVSVLWPAVPLVVEDSISGLAFGIITSVMNLSCAIVPLIVAAIYTNSGEKYIPNVEYLFTSFGAIGFFVGLYMNYYDYYIGNSQLNRGTPSSTSDDSSSDDASSDLRKGLLKP